MNARQPEPPLSQLDLPKSRRESPPAEPSIIARVRPGPAPVVPTHDDEIYPLYAARFAELLLSVVGQRVSGSVLEQGSRRGEVTRELVRRHRRGKGMIVAMEGSPGRLSLARTRLAEATQSGQVFLRAHDPAQRLPFAHDTFDLCLSNLVLGDVPDRRAVLADLVRVARPGARIAATLPLDGTFAEVIDLLDEVLVTLAHDEARAALAAYRHALPTGEQAAAELEQLGIEEVDVAVARWDLLFASSREFFYAPVIEQGPLPRWKAIAGRGEKMHAVFLTLKQSIDRYYAGRPFALGVVAGCVHGRKPVGAVVDAPGTA